MKRTIRITILVLFLLILSGLLLACNSNAHIHKWSSWYDNGDGNHMRMCLIDSEHMEYEPHIFSDYEITKEATDILPGEKKRACLSCGYTEKSIISPTGDHVFDQEIVDEKYLYQKESTYCAIYYKSCECGAYGNPDYLFEKSLLPEGYSDLKYIKGNGTQYIDTGVENDRNHTITYNSNRSVSRLPEGYQEVEYIESTGTQYINTGLIDNNSVATEVELCQSYDTTSIENQIIGFTGNKGCGIGTYGSTWWEISNPSSLSADNPYVLYWYKKGEEWKKSINNVLTTGSDGNTDVSSLNPLLLFCAWLSVGHSDRSYFCNSKLYWCKIWQDRTLVRNFIPCYRILDNSVGLFDVVTNTFYGNSGTGEFLIGKDSTTSLPMEYKQIEYIESTGTQYIDTGLPTKDGYSYDITYMYTSLTDDVDILSATGKEGDRYIQSVLINYCYKSNRTIVNDKQTLSAAPEAGKIYNSVISFEGKNFTHYIDGVLAHESIIVPYTNIRNLYLFARNSVDRASSFSRARVYYYKVYDQGRLIQDFVPCVKKGTGEIGFYDVVGQIFYKNEGSGQFISGDSGNVLKDHDSQFVYIDGKYYNSITDERDIFHLQIQTFTDNDYEKNIYDDFITSSGPYNVTIDKSNFSTSTKKLRIKYNGGVNDITIGYFPVDLNNDYTFSMDVYSFDPTTLGGIVLGNISFSKVNSDYSGELPENFVDNYTLCEYIKSTGPQFINTGIIPTVNTGIEIAFRANSIEDNGCFIYGSAENSYNDNSFELYPWNSKWQTNIGNQTYYVSASGAITTLSIRNSTAEFLGETTDPYTFTSESNPTRPLYLFALNRASGTILSNSGNCLYYCKIYNESGIIVRDLIPCIRKTDGKVGLYELVENKFYDNDGSGEFISGPTETSNDKGTLNVGINYNGHISMYNYSRIYDANIYEGDQLIMTLIPAIRNSDSMVGMYDILNNKFYETTSSSQFISGSVICHKLNEGIIIKEPTYCEDGEICYTCSICGTKIYNKLPKLAYKVSFVADEGVKSIRIYPEPNSEKYEIKNVAYSRNSASYNYSKKGASVMFYVELNEGYKLDSYDFGDERLTVTEFMDFNIILGLSQDIEINLKTVKE